MSCQLLMKHHTDLINESLRDQTLQSHFFGFRTMSKMIDRMLGAGLRQPREMILQVSFSLCLRTKQVEEVCDAENKARILCKVIVEVSHHGNLHIDVCRCPWNIWDVLYRDPGSKHEGR